MLDLSQTPSLKYKALRSSPWCNAKVSGPVPRWYKMFGNLTSLAPAKSKCSNQNNAESCCRNSMAEMRRGKARSLVPYRIVVRDRRDGLSQTQESSVVYIKGCDALPKASRPRRSRHVYCPSAPACRGIDRTPFLPMPPSCLTLP